MKFAERLPKTICYNDRNSFGTKDLQSGSLCWRNYFETKKSDEKVVIHMLLIVRKKVSYDSIETEFTALIDLFDEKKGGSAR